MNPSDVIGFGATNRARRRRRGTRVELLEGNIPWREGLNNEQFTELFAIGHGLPGTMSMQFVVSTATSSEVDIKQGRPRARLASSNVGLK